MDSNGAHACIQHVLTDSTNSISREYCSLKSTINFLSVWKVSRTERDRDPSSVKATFTSLISPLTTCPTMSVNPPHRLLCLTSCCCYSHLLINDTWLLNVAIQKPGRCFLSGERFDCKDVKHSVWICEFVGRCFTCTNSLPRRLVGNKIVLVL